MVKDFAFHGSVCVTTLYEKRSKRSFLKGLNSLFFRGLNGMNRSLAPSLRSAIAESPCEKHAMQGIDRSPRVSGVKKGSQPKMGA